MRRRFGLPVVGPRTVLLILLLFIGLVYVTVTILADFVMKLGQYGPHYYEPKDLQREEHLEQPEKLQKKSF